MSGERTYIAIDLKSFYASVECVERGLDPLDTNLVVADRSRTDKTICLAASPSLKAHGVGARPRLFEVVQHVHEVNTERKRRTGRQGFRAKSASAAALRTDPSLELDYIVATPRMALYIQYSTRIYQIYMKYVAPEDIHVYSIDEVFMDVTAYLRTYGMSAHELAMTIIRDVLKSTGITATAGVGTNLYLSKVAMDIVAKHSPADTDGVRIAELDEMTYRKTLWSHRPLTDFWRVGAGIASRLEQYGLYTMGDIARQSLRNEEVLYRQLGVNAELLIDHAWGWEPCTMADIKAYRPETKSLSSGQVLKEPYTAQKACVVVREMAEALALDLLDKGLVTDRLDLTIGYDTTSLENPAIRSAYQGEVTRDHYGRAVPKHSCGGASLDRPTSSATRLMEAAAELYDKVVNPRLLVRRLTLCVGHVLPEREAETNAKPVQLDLFADPDAGREREEKESAALDKERRAQQAMLDIKRRFGGNAILRGCSFEDGATARERNEQIGGHRA